MRPFPCVLGAAASLLFVQSPGEGLACAVHVDNPEVVFPVDKMEPQVLCLLAAVVNDYTTHRVMPSMLTPI